MENHCINCKLKCELEKQRSMLNKLLYDKSVNLLNKQIIGLSQSIDELIVNCSNCKKHILHY